MKEGDANRAKSGFGSSCVYGTGKTYVFQKVVWRGGIYIQLQHNSGGWNNQWKHLSLVLDSFELLSVLKVAVSAAAAVAQCLVITVPS